MNYVAAPQDFETTKDLLSDKQLIFTVTTGRSGTEYLSKALGLLDGVTSRHEPWPEFVEVMREAQWDESVAYDFLVRKKLPAVAAEEGTVYVETSHLFCKGFLEPMLDLGLKLDLIHLERPKREVAASLLRLGTIPGKSEWYLSPDDPGVLPLSGWTTLHDYQLCYWYCLEIERRSRQCAETVRGAGGIFVSTTLSEATTTEGFSRVVSDLRLPPLTRDGLDQLKLLTRKPVNRKVDGVRRSVIDDGSLLDELEAQVLDRIGPPDSVRAPAERKPASVFIGTRWIDRVNQIRSLLENMPPDAGTTIVVDDGKLPAYVAETFKTIPLPERDGLFAGRPRSGDDALKELLRLRDGGAGTLVIAWPAFWWLDYYQELGKYLNDRCRCVSRNDCAIVYELGELDPHQTRAS
ncbi:MAG TPA: hypothetical protein VMO47_02980 [Rhodothermales bacterium]|nr:hypothetical protein [Rhodothermales bacterium]